MSDKRDHVHLGDGAYACHDGHQFWLGANHHENMTVALEPGACVGFLNYVKKYAPTLLAEAGLQTKED